MSEQTQPEAALTDNRFETPFTLDDVFHDIESEAGDFDIHALKLQVEEIANRRSKEILKKQPCHRKAIQEEIWDLITCKRFRKGPIDFANVAKEEMMRKITESLENKTPLVLTFSFYPAKVLNPLKTFSEDGSEIDIGEVASILRLYEITKTISAIHPYGVKFVITQDGLKYHDVFGVPKSSAELYANRIREVIKFLNVGEYIETVEETELYPDDYHEIRRDTIEETRDLYNSGEPEILSMVKKLRSNVALSLALKDTGADIGVLALVFNHCIPPELLRDISPYAHELREEIGERSLQATFKYIGTYKAPYKCGVYTNHLPGAIKCTVHPKEGQIGLYPVNNSANLFPHHGQGHMSFKGKSDVDSVRLCFAADLRRANNNNSIKGIILPSDRYPFSDGKHPFTMIKR